MPRPSKNGSSKEHQTGTPVKPAPVEWGGFVDIRLDDNDKLLFEDWCKQNRTEIWLGFMECLGKGFKFGLSYDKEGDFYLASFTAQGSALIGLTNRYCMTARNTDWEGALNLLMFKHIVLAQENWGNFRPKSHRMEQFG